MDFKRLLFFKEPEKKNTFRIEKKQDYKNTQPDNFKMSCRLKLNEDYIKKRLSFPKNNDIVIKDFIIKGERRCFIVLIDGMVDTQITDLSIIETMFKLPFISDEAIYTSKDAVIEKLIAHTQCTSTNNMEKVIEEINYGSCAVFVDGFDVYYIAKTIIRE